MLALLGFACFCAAISLADAAAANAGSLWYYSLMPPPGRPGLRLLLEIMVAADGFAALAGWLVWRRPDGRPHYQAALKAWGWVMGFSAICPPLLFGLQIYGPAVAAGIMLASSAALTAQKFMGLSVPAAFLMVPVFSAALFWVYLTAGFWWLNP